MLAMNGTQVKWKGKPEPGGVAGRKCEVDTERTRGMMLIARVEVQLCVM